MAILLHCHHFVAPWPLALGYRQPKMAILFPCPLPGACHYPHPSLFPGFALVARGSSRSDVLKVVFFSPRVARPESVLRRGATPATPSAFTQPNRVNYTMADTFTSLHYHVVFSTKGREPWLRLGAPVKRRPGEARRKARLYRRPSGPAGLSIAEIGCQPACLRRRSLRVADGGISWPLRLPSSR